MGTSLCSSFVTGFFSLPPRPLRHIFNFATFDKNLLFTMAASDVEPTAAQSGNSPNSKDKSPKKDETATMSDAMNHFATGKRHMLVQDIPNAVESLALACELLSEQYGETAGECSEAYLYYGKALLEMARLESGVLGNALDGDDGSTESEGSQDEEESPEEAEESQDDDKDAEKEKTEEKKETENKEEEKNGEEKDAEKEKDEDKTDTESVGGDGVTKEEKENGDVQEQEAEDDEDPSNLQLAW